MMNAQGSSIASPSASDETRSSIHGYAKRTAGMSEAGAESPTDVLDEVQVAQSCGDSSFIDDNDSNSTRSLKRKCQVRTLNHPGSDLFMEKLKAEGHQSKISHWSHHQLHPKQDQDKSMQRKEQPSHPYQLYPAASSQQDPHTRGMQLLAQERAKNRDLTTELQQLNHQNMQSLKQLHALDAELRRSRAQHKSLQQEHGHVMRQLANSLQERETLKQELLHQLADALKDNERLQQQIACTTEPSLLEQQLIDTLGEKRVLEEQLYLKTKTIQELEAKLHSGKKDVLEQLKNHRLLAEIEQLKHTIAEMEKGRSLE